MMDATLFCEIIESIPSVRFLRQEDEGGYTFRMYQESRGSLVIIDYDDDTFTPELGIQYLNLLGLQDMIPALFPKDPAPITPIATPIIAETAGDKSDCLKCNGIGQLQLAEKLIPCIDCNGTGSVVTASASGV